MFDFKRDIAYTIIAIITTFLAIAIPALPPILSWRRRGPLARITRVRGRQAKRRDFR
jgi:hypothetical protein